MAGPFIDISVIGSKKLEKMLAGLADKGQRKVVSNALIKSRTRVKRAILAHIRSGEPFEKPTGDLARIWKSTKLFSRSTRNGTWRGIRLPDTKEEAIKVMAVEYGHKKKGGGRVGPRSFIRSGVNAVQDKEFRRIGDQIEKNIIKEARRLAR